MKKILSFGEIIWDVFPDGDAVIGGAPLNFAAHAVKCGAKASLLSAVGNDALGAKALEELQRLGIGTAFVGKSELATGRCIVTLSNGSPSYEVCRPAAYDRIALTPTTVDSINAEKFDAFCFGTLAARESVSRKALEQVLQSCAFDTVFCDINLRPDCYDEGSVRLCFENANILKISEEEEPLLGAFPFYRALCESGLEQSVGSLFEALPNLSLILFTKGEKGSTIYQKNQSPIHIAPCKAQVVSTVGAGDSFGASFLTAFLSGASILDAGTLASRISAFVVSQKEAIPEYEI